MTSLKPVFRSKPLAPLVIALACGCRDEVALGSWGGSSLNAPAVSCSRAGVPGPLNTPGATIAPTGTFTDWSFPGPLDSLEWDLQIERELERDGYFWALQFGFVDGDGGYFGLQANGTYSSDPPSSPVEITKMAVFSIAGDALGAELGDIPYPDARIHDDFATNGWWTIHARYAWQACRVYRLRLARQVSGGSVAYAASIRDLTSGVTTLLGRIRVPPVWGALDPTSVMYTQRFGHAPMTSCSVLEHGSAVFGAPSANEGALRPSSRSNHFYATPSCPGSRFTDFPDAVRHELGVRP